MGFLTSLKKLTSLLASYLILNSRNVIGRLKQLNKSILLPRAISNDEVGRRAGPQLNSWAQHPIYVNIPGHQICRAQISTWKWEARSSLQCMTPVALQAGCYRPAAAAGLQQVVMCGSKTGPGEKVGTLSRHPSTMRRFVGLRICYRFPLNEASYMGF